MLGTFPLSGAPLGGSAAAAAPPPAIDPSTALTGWQEHLRQAVRNRFRASMPGTDVGEWLHWASEDVKASRMTWYEIPTHTLHRPPLRRRGLTQTGAIGPVNYSDPVYTTAQLMGWYPDGLPGPVRFRRMGRHMIQSFATGFDSTTIVDAYTARIYATPSYGANLDCYTSYAAHLGKEP